MIVQFLSLSIISFAVLRISAQDTASVVNAFNSAGIVPDGE